MSQIVESSLEPGESIVWQGKQSLKTVMARYAWVLIVCVVIGVFLYSGGLPNNGTCTINGTVRPITECAGGMKNATLIFIFIGLISPFVAYLYYRVTEYVITDRRIIIKSGLIGTDLRSINYDQIRSVFVNVSIVGKLLGSGSIFIDTGSVTYTQKSGNQVLYEKFLDIENPYEVNKLLQKQVNRGKESVYSGGIPSQAPQPSQEGQMPQA